MTEKLTGNALFRSMTAAERRVAIARDVIKHLRSGRLKSKPGVYIKHTDSTKALIRDLNNNDELSDVLPAQCRVCALGGLMVATVDRFDACKVSLVNRQLHGPLRYDDSSINRYYHPHIFSLESDDFAGYLKKFFSARQLDIIEMSFEKWDRPEDDNLDAAKISVKVGKEAQNFGRKYGSPKIRMAAIMKNIIENDGTFRPNVSVKRMPKGLV